MADTDVDFADVTDPSILCNDDNSSVSCDANVDSSVFSDADILDTSVSCDGTWQIRGFSSLNGTVACISMDTGEVLDIEIMSRYCQSCDANATLEKTDPKEFAEFRATHEPDCQINHDGSALAMEAEGTVNIFKRSIHIRGLRYVNFYDDGDSKSCSRIKNIISPQEG